MSSSGIEPAIPVIKRLQTYFLDCTATGSASAINRFTENPRPGTVLQYSSLNELATMKQSRKWKTYVKERYYKSSHVSVNLTRIFFVQEGLKEVGELL